MATQMLNLIFIVIMKFTPRTDHFYMPAEWQPHTACWIGWPCRPASWPFPLARAQASYTAVIQAISRFEPVKVIALSNQVEEVKQLCGAGVKVISLTMDDAWLRDMGPTFLVNNQGHLAGVNWQFNAWGYSHPDHAQDATFAQRLLSWLKIPGYNAPFVLEGGAIHVDGEGTVLTTETCVLNPNRNPHLSRADVETLLSEYLGISKIIWLGQGLQDDETDGHIDNLACFVRPGVVLALTCHDPQDSNYTVLQDNVHRLRLATDAKGRKLEVIEVEQPAWREFAGTRLALSYVNFYLANGGIVLPIFSDPADKAAIETITRLFPQHQVVTVSALDLIHGGGGIHCITQQQPNSLSCRVSAS
jgi:agmatine deiminase